MESKQELLYKTKITSIGIEVWDGIPDDVWFFDPESAGCMDMTKAEFKGMLKGFNRFTSIKAYSSNSKEFKKYYKKFSDLLPSNLSPKACWMGRLVGFNTYEKKKSS